METLTSGPLGTGFAAVRDVGFGFSEDLGFPDGRAARPPGGDGRGLTSAGYQAAPENSDTNRNFHRLLQEALPVLVWSVRNAQTPTPDSGTHSNPRPSSDSRDGFAFEPEYVNPRWTEYTGLTAEQARRLGWGGFVHPDDLAPVRRAWERAAEQGGVGEVEARLRRADGAYRWFLCRLAPARDEQGRILRWVGAAADIDDRKRAEAALAEAKAAADAARESAEAADRAKDQFLAVLSHELRTPLTPVLLTASAMQANPSLPDAVRDDLAVVREQVEVEARLIDDLLDLTRIARGKLELHRGRLDVHELLRRLAALSEPAARAGGLLLTLDLSAPRHHVEADPVRLRQLFSNLLSNAIKFTPAGGSVVVRTTCSPCSPFGDAGQGSPPPGLRDSILSTQHSVLTIEVIDTGVGIDPELLPRLFNPFEQGGRGVTRHYGGLGLGLVIGKAIAELHGGAVSAASPGPGRGTTLTVVLPLAASTAATTAASPWSAPGRPAAAPGRRAAASRILLVDDHPPTLRLLARLLRGLGHEVLTADGHDAALRAAEGYEVDLVISDIGLAESSGGTGWDLMRALSARRPLPAIALTGYGTEEDVRRSRAAGFREHLTKPLDLDRLNAAIGRVLGDSAPEAS